MMLQRMAPPPDYTLHGGGGGGDSAVPTMHRARRLQQMQLDDGGQAAYSPPFRQQQWGEDGPPPAFRSRGGGVGGGGMGGSGMGDGPTLGGGGYREIIGRAPGGPPRMGMGRGLGSGDMPPPLTPPPFRLSQSFGWCNPPPTRV